MRWARLRNGAERAALALGCAALLGACSNAVDGAPVAAAIPPASETEAVAQSLLDLGEAGLVRYQGTLSSASDDQVSFDVTAAGTGEIAGSITLAGKPAAVLVIERSTYLKAAADFWAALSGVGSGQSKGAAVADRWVKVPAGLIGVEFGDVFNPTALGQDLGDGLGAGGKPLSEAGRGDVGGAPALKVDVDAGTVYLAEKAPHGVVKVELDRAGRSDPTAVEQFAATVTDASADVATFYQDVAAQAGQLGAPVDVLTTVQEGPHTFEGCGAASCSIVVQFTNKGKVAVKVSVRGNWIGDNAPLGSCEAQAGPVAAGQPGSASCTISSPQWVQFYQRANSVPGNHPYSVEWSTVVLADPPDLTKLTARAGAKPADAKAPRTDGSHAVYSIDYAAGGDRKVWKYGVVENKFWTDQADRQLRLCLGATGAVCDADLVTATGDAASAQGLLKQLVDGYRSSGGECPTGQWVGCKR